MRLLSLLGLVMGLGCKRIIPAPAYESGLDLFPLETGRTWTYLVQETTYTTSGAVAHAYWLRLRLDTPTVDAYKRPCFYAVWDTAPFLDSTRWGVLRVGLAYRDQQQAELWENNTRLLLLRFPLSPDLRWNRYEYASRPAEVCSYRDTDTIWSTTTRSYPRSVWVVRRADTTGLLERALFYEAYQRGTGLVQLYERYDKFELEVNGGLTRSTDSYFRAYTLVAP